MLLFAVGFNLWLYRLEPTSLVDPNDNAFQFALVDRTNQIWDFAQQRCATENGKRKTANGVFNPMRFPFTFCLFQFTFLLDHWVPNWAEGYNLPYYYSHIPQIAIVSSYRLLTFFSQFQISNFKFQISLFTYYHWVIYLLMSLFPVSVFLALRVIKLPWLATGIGAVLASQISTDGLYGLDPPSFLFRGWGLSSQLFAMIWLPLAIAYAWKYISEGTSFMKAVFFLVATTMGHLGIGYIALLSLLPLGLAKPKKLVLLGATVLFFLSYWIVPIFLTNDYHNVSFWDPVWKFDSFGWRLTMDRLFNGELFDWGRFPTITLLVFVGLFVSRPFGLLFVFWLLLYFGRATWGGLIDLVPGMSEFHLSRFIVGLHLAGLFLIPIAISWLVSFVPKQFPRVFCYFVILLLCYFVIYPQTIRYAQHNDFLIKQANENYKKVLPDLDTLFSVFKELPPGRIYPGRGGNWGKDFKVAETTMFMHLSTYGLPVTLWLPETWSPNSDVEQYFNDNYLSHYALFGIRYVVTPPSVSPKPFWKLLKETTTWKLYSVIPASEPESRQDQNWIPGQARDDNTGAYIAGGVRPAIVSSSKLNYINLVHLWIQSEAHEKGLYPELTFAKDFPRKTGLPNFRMLDEVTYQVPDGSTHNLFTEPPVYMTGTEPDVKILSESREADMIFHAKVEVGKNCTECIVVLRQSSHPNWQVTIDGKPTDHITVFPFYVAVGVSPGTHEIIFSYQPSGLKIFLLVLEMGTVLGLIVLWIRAIFSTTVKITR